MNPEIKIVKTPKRRWWLWTIIAVLLIGAATFGVFVAMNDTPIKDMLNKQAVSCNLTGGKWSMNDGGCWNSCEALRSGKAPGDWVCPTVIMPGCICGEERCWTGSKCEDL
jgi:hypothetical protein